MLCRLMPMKVSLAWATTENDNVCCALTPRCHWWRDDNDGGDDDDDNDEHFVNNNAALITFRYYNIM